MKKVSNQFLLAMLIVAIAVSLVGTLISLNKIGALSDITGKATSGTMNLYVPSAATVNVTQTNVNFSNVTVPWNSFNCTLNSETGGDGNCDPETVGTNADGSFEFENIGNVNINVSVISDINASELFGSANYGSSFQWKCRTKAGAGATAVIPSYQEVSKSYVLCYGNMSYLGTNQAYLDIQLTVPADATKNTPLASTITFNAASS